MPSGLLQSFLAAIQASLSVLLVMSYGGIASWLGLLNSDHTKAVSKICVRMFLPALLVTKIGAELHAGSAARYGIILLWAFICHLVSFLIGMVAHLWLGMPDWTTVALMFNNTTSYPLLLIAALDETGILKTLIVTDESTSAAIERAKSYFLVFATVSSCLTFAVGPRLIDSEHAPESDGKLPPLEQDATTSDDAESQVDETTRLLLPTEVASHIDNPVVKNTFFPSRRKSLAVPETSPPKPSHDTRKPYLVPQRQWGKLRSRTKWWLLLVSDFFNAPLVGALLGAVIGLTPALQRAFFNDTNEGGIFTAWLTASLKNIGGLFVPLPVVVAGISLYTAMQDAKRQGGRSLANIPWTPTIFILTVRFVVWPVVSISCIYGMITRTTWPGPDPMLWFALMLMPTGPPAMKLITLVQVSDAEDEEETSIAKLLTISYLISPILSLTVVGSLKASQMAIQ